MPSPSAKSRRPATFSAIQSTWAAVSPWVKPTSRQNPRPMAPATRPSIVTDAWDTRWSTTRTVPPPLDFPGQRYSTGDHRCTPARCAAASISPAGTPGTPSVTTDPAGRSLRPRTGPTPPAGPATAWPPPGWATPPCCSTCGAPGCSPTPPWSVGSASAAGSPSWGPAA